MNPNRKAEATNFGSKTVFTGGERQVFSVSDCSEQMPLIQCRQCSLIEARIRQFERIAMCLAAHIDNQRRRDDY